MGGLEDGGALLPRTGVKPAFDLESGLPLSDLLRALAAGEDVGAVFFWKNPAMLRCLGSGCFDVLELALFGSLGGARGVAISLPSIPLAMTVSSIVTLIKPS